MYKHGMDVSGNWRHTLELWPRVMMIHQCSTVRLTGVFSLNLQTTQRALMVGESHAHFGTVRSAACKKSKHTHTHFAGLLLVHVSAIPGTGPNKKFLQMWHSSVNGDFPAKNIKEHKGNILITCKDLRG